MWRSSPGQQQLSLHSGMTIGMDVLLTRHLNLRTLVGGSIYDIPFADRSFDLVTCKVVMEHLDEPARAVAEIARVLVRGGALIINPPNLWNYGRVLANAISAKVLPERWRLSLVRASDSREPQDIFPVRYPREYPTSAERNVYGHWLGSQGDGLAPTAGVFPSNCASRKATDDADAGSEAPYLPNPCSVDRQCGGSFHAVHGRGDGCGSGAGGAG